MAVPRDEKACKVGWNGLIGSAFSKNKLNEFEEGKRRGVAYTSMTTMFDERSARRPGRNPGE